MAGAQVENFNSIITVPRNWQKMFGTDNPEDINNMFLSISAYTTPTINYLTTDITNVYAFEKVSQFVGGYRFYYPKDNIQENIRHIYSESNSKFGEAIMEIRGGITKNMTSAVQAVQSTTQGVLNEEPHIYNKSSRRVFSLNIPLIAYDDLDKDIYDITRFFRRLSYPRKAKDAFAKNLVNTIEYPHVFKIRGGLFDTNQPVVDGKYGSFFVLEEFTIDYSPEVKLLKDGVPMQAMLTLMFTELNLVFGDDFDSPPVNVNVSYSGKGENRVPLIGKDQQAFIDKITKKSRKQQPDPVANPTALPRKLDSKSRPTNDEPANKSLADNIRDRLKNSRLAKRINNLPETVEKAVLNEVRKTIQSSTLYKKVTAITDIDPVHRLEVRNILKKTRGF